MKCLVLAAGYGTRLGELTKNKPKPLLNLDGRPIIEHLLTRLAMHGIFDIIVNLHYLPSMVTDYVKDRALYYYEPRLLGHKKTIFALKNWLEDEDFMVVNADTLTDLNYTLMCEFHKPGTITVAMDEWRATGTWIYSKEYFTNQNLPVIPYRQENLIWQDLGTPERLEATRKRLEEEK